MSAEVVDVLRRARARIEDPAKWTKGSLTAHRLELGPDECQVCMAGAVLWAASGEPGRSFTRTITFLQQVTGDHLVGRWNDAPERTHAEVLAAFDRAIELAEAS